jgi:SAM-dependent methyltransferase
MTDETYVHGYSREESGRLLDQAETLAELLHHDSVFPAGATVLEAGCGVGAQTVILAGKNPGVRITSVDISPASLAQARQRVQERGLAVTFQQADIFHLPFPEASFDHVFVCFTLEHLSQPLEALQRLRRVLKPGGTLTAIEGDHGSCFFHPASPAALQAIHCLITLQARSGGDALIGRRLYPLFHQTGFGQIRVSPRMAYADAGRPEWVDGFTLKTFTAMVEGIREPALQAGLIDTARFEQGLEGLRRTTAEDGSFCYTFFKAVGFK